MKMFKAENSGRANALKKVKRLCKKFDFTYEGQKKSCL
jgi:hypothetical protein